MRKRRTLDSQFTPSHFQNKNSKFGLKVNTNARSTDNSMEYPHKDAVTLPQAPRPNWDHIFTQMEVCTALQSTRELTLFVMPERNGFFPRTSWCFSLHQANHTIVAPLADGVAGALSCSRSTPPQWLMRACLKDTGKRHGEETLGRAIGPLCAAAGFGLRPLETCARMHCHGIE